VTGDSLALLEKFFVRMRLGIPDSMNTAAREIDAFLILRDELEREQRNGTSQN
jgi:hypothetical protein